MTDEMLVLGRVDRDSEYMQLSVGTVEDQSRVVALLAKASDGSFVVEDLPNAEISDDDRRAVHDELRFYLIERGGPDPWKYAQYHAGTTSNVYSHVHWSWFPYGAEPDGAARRSRDDKGTAR